LGSLTYRSSIIVILHVLDNDQGREEWLGQLGIGL
jgi:hypothetical protein